MVHTTPCGVEAYRYAERTPPFVALFDLCHMRNRWFDFLGLCRFITGDPREGWLAVAFFSRPTLCFGLLSVFLATHPSRWSGWAARSFGLLPLWKTRGQRVKPSHVRFAVKWIETSPLPGFGLFFWGHLGLKPQAKPSEVPLRGLPYGGFIHGGTHSIVSRRASNEV